MLKYSANNQTFYRSNIECLNWLGWRDSNPRMSAPKTDALPLGHTPALNLAGKARTGVIVSFFKLFYN